MVIMILIFCCEPQTLPGSIPPLKKIPSIPDPGRLPGPRNPEVFSCNTGPNEPNKTAMECYE